MSVVGLDLGNESGVVGVARQRGIDIVLNEESKRETPMVISFGDSQRFLGVAGAACGGMNPKNTVTQIKRLVGRKFSDPDAQRDMGMLPFKCTEGPDGEILIHVMYMGEPKVFTPIQVMAMAFATLKTIAEKNLEAAVTDCVIGIPIYLTDSQRRAYLDAAAIAGLNPLRLFHETTATALAYGIYKTDLSETEPLNVAFVDVGHAAMQVCIAAFKKGQLKVLASAFDRSLGGRDFDEALFNHFADQFKPEYKIDVRSNVRACQRLRAACEKLKKVLSANPGAPIQVECLMDEKDVKGFMKREDFEALAASVLDRVKAPCQKALQESGLTADQISAVELVGSGSRVPALVKVLTTFFGKEPRRTMNASECVARGCTLQCAMLSPTFRVREFEVQDTYPYAIALSWKQASASAAEGAEGEDATAQPNQIVFTKGNPLPSSKLLTFYRTETFTIDAFYANPEDLPPGYNPKIGTFTVGPFAPTKADAGAQKPKLKVKIRLNLHGVLSLDSATLLEEEDGDAMEADKKEAAPGEAEDAPAAGADADSQAKAESGKKKKLKKTEVPIKSQLNGVLPPADLQKLVELEYEMALQDRVMEETKERKNAVEAYVYEMRNKLADQLSAYATDAEKELLGKILQETEDWLYEDGENETKGVYIAKLEELKKMGDPVEQRKKEEEERPGAIGSMEYCIRSFAEAARSLDPRYAHIEAAEKEKVLEECAKADAWLKDALKQLQGLGKTSNPSVLAADIKKKAEALDRFCKPIMMKPKPAPPSKEGDVPPPPKEEPKKDTEGPQPMEAEGGAPPNPDSMQTD